uniref:AA_TRNA_LIGASE_II domain-containing protein n=1 Tax=Rhabditophanes sp. KR3021 TaxID=114890 RepID=A0AC35UBL4_9BILA
MSNSGKLYKFVASTVINELDDIKRVREIYKEPDSLSTLLEMMDGKPFERITFSKAIEILKRKKDVPQSVGLSKANELSLVKYCNGPVFVTNFPAIQKPFYTETESGEMQKLETKSFDLLAPLVGELAGGSVRKSTVADLSNAPDSKNIQWYKDLRSHGYPVSGGFGIGMERLIQSLFGIPSIKDTLPFPRYYKHIQC